MALAARHAVPAMYEWREFAAAGGLEQLWIEPRQRVSPGWDRTMVITLKTAKTLGLTIQPSILARADEE